MEEKKQQMKIQIRGNDAMLGGAYANHLMVHMTKEEFALDFINLVPPHASLNGRIMVTPANFKRMMQAMQNSLDRFEKEFGELKVTSAQQPPAEFVQ